MTNAKTLKLMVYCAWFVSIGLAWIPSNVVVHRLILWKHYGMNRVHDDNLRIVSASGDSLRVSNGETIGAGQHRLRSWLAGLVITVIAILIMLLLRLITRSICPAFYLEISRAFNDRKW